MLNHYIKLWNDCQVFLRVARFVLTVEEKTILAIEGRPGVNLLQVCSASNVPQRSRLSGYRDASEQE